MCVRSPSTRAWARWRVLDSIGGRNGWYSLPLAWWARGFIDRAMGGVGLRRGRRNPDRLAVGDTVDFWRVEERIPEHLLRLRAEMKLPGLAWLEFTVEPTDEGACLRQRAIFHPRGLAGHAYWKSISPFHNVVFGSMARNIAKAAEPRGRPRSPGRYDTGAIRAFKGACSDRQSPKPGVRVLDTDVSLSRAVRRDLVSGVFSIPPVLSGVTPQRLFGAAGLGTPQSGLREDR